MDTETSVIYISNAIGIRYMASPYVYFLKRIF